jgi:hypothetical protein
MEPIVTFRGLFPSEAAVDQAGREWGKLSRQLGGMGRCHVVVERPHRSQHSGGEYRVTVRIRDAVLEQAVSFHPGCANHVELTRAVKQAFANARRALMPHASHRPLPLRARQVSA